MSLLRSIHLFVLLCVGTGSHAQTCDCSANFDWMVRTFEQNDAGYPYVLETKGTADLARHTDAVKAKADTSTNVQVCQLVLSEWLDYFRKGHIGIWARSRGPAPPRPISEPYAKPPAPMDLTEASLIELLSSKGYRSHPMEGIWTDGSTQLGVVRSKKRHGLDVVFLRGSSEHWKPKDVRAVLDFGTDPDTLSGVIYVTQSWWDQFVTSRYPMSITAQLVKGSNGTLLDLFGLWEREYPKVRIAPLDTIRYALANSSGPFALPLNDRTMYLRIPSFSMEAKSTIDSLLGARDEDIRNRENLIIDIRNGTGGGDASYAGLIPYLFTTPIRGMDIALRATEANALAYAGYMKYFPDDTASSNELRRLSERMRKNVGTFIPRDEQGLRVQVDSSYTAMAIPQRVAILCNGGNASTDEQFLLEARTSWKVKVFGTQTKGALDVSNLNKVDSPDGLFAMAYTMSRSYRIPDLMIDDHGIQPDHFLDGGIPEDHWVDYVQWVLER